MTSKIGAYDFTKLHLVRRDNGFIELYERRLQIIITTANGKPRVVIPDGVGFESWHRYKSKPDDKVTRAYVLVPVNIAVEHPEHIKR